MDVKVNIDGEQINKMVADAILESTLGEAVRNAVERATKNLSTSYNNPLDIVIKGHVSEMVRKVLIDDYQDKIKAGVKDAIAKKVTDDFISKILEAGLREF